MAINEARSILGYPEVSTGICIFTFAHNAVIPAPAIYHSHQSWKIYINNIIINNNDNNNNNIKHGIAKFFEK